MTEMVAHRDTDHVQSFRVDENREYTEAKLKAKGIGARGGKELPAPTVAPIAVTKKDKATRVEK